MTQPRRPALDVISHSPEQTRAIGALLGKALERGSLVLLGGMIGTGKTTFAQGLAMGLKVTTPVTSPTFTIVSEHSGHDSADQPVRIYHIDLYRLEDDESVLSFGFDEYLDDPDAITIIEWPERARKHLPEDYLLVELTDIAESKRGIAFMTHDKRYAPALEHLKREMAGARG